MKENYTRIYYKVPLSFLSLGIVILIMSVTNYQNYYTNKLPVIDKIPFLITLLISLIFIGSFISLNILKSTYIVISKNSICYVNIFSKHIFTWESIVSYNVIQKKGSTALCFQTTESLKNKWLLNSKNALVISSIFIKNTTIQDIIDVINKYKE